ncbi:MAG: CoA transferase [Dehalococcoidia bacterium]|nr:CoA transferase [Dehalococcoidia bacterium]
MSGGQRAFAGVKVADFSWVGVGPITMRYLADHGATVVRVESISRADFLRTSPPYKDGTPGVNRSAFWAAFNAGKLGLTLDLKKPKAMDVARKLIAWADVMAESFTAGAMERLGLGYEEARRINPGIIYISSTNQGQTGPYARQPGFGTQLVSLSGYTHLLGWPDREPAGAYGAYTDFISPRFGAAMVAAALAGRRRTGEGMCIDLSQLEAGLQFLAPQVLDYATSGRIATRAGNAHASAAPHNAYPCRGDDRWCAIAVANDAQWTALRLAMGDPDWSQEKRFATVLGRRRHAAALDENMGAWTQAFDAHELMRLLQATGVPAGVVQNATDLFADPQLAAQGHFVALEHPEIGRHHYERFAFRLSESASGPDAPAPLLGQHNEQVLRDVLGCSDDEIADMIIEGVLE